MDPASTPAHLDTGAAPANAPASPPGVTPDPAPGEPHDGAASGPKPRAPAEPPIEAPPATSIADLDQAAAALADRAAVFARTPPREKAALLRATLQALFSVAPEMVSRSCRAAGVDPGGPLAGAAWLSGPVALAATVRRFAEALEDIAANARPRLPASHLRRRLDGRVVARLAPASLAERAFHGGAEATAVLAEGVQPEDAIRGQAAFYRRPDAPGGVALVLAGGVAPAAGPLRALDALFVEGKVAILETTPACAHLGPLYERAFAPLIGAGFLRVVHGGGAPGAHLAATLGEPLLAASGGGGPVIIVPALYGADELWFIARRLVSEMAAGRAFGMPAPQSIVVAGCWAQRGLFLTTIARALVSLERLVPASLVPQITGDVEPSTGAGSAYRQPAEPGSTGDAMPPAGVSIVTAGRSEPAAMLDAAVERHAGLPGTQSAEIVAHVLHEEDPEVLAALDRAAVRLRCRVLGINQWPALVTFRGDAPEGPRMLAQVDKTIVRGPLRSARSPAYFYDGAGVRAARRGERLCAFQVAPSLGGLLRGL